MREPTPISVAQALADWERFDTVVDARSPAEFAGDHLPGAVSAPVLDDAQRAAIGTLYKQRGAFEAKRAGAAIVARNVGTLIGTLFATRDKAWRPLVYCWRGGNRSAALATVMAAVGWRTSVLEGGYQAFRRHVIDDLAARAPRHRFVVLAGRTGTAKSRLLQQLAARGEQVLDLEALACHRGSVLGGMPDAPQPGQKRFETLLWSALRAFDVQRVVFVESESRKVGQCQVPEGLIGAVRAAHCIRIEAPIDVRSRFLLEEYRHFRDDVAHLRGLLGRLVPLHGRERVAQWQALAESGHWLALIERLLAEHYDPSYDRSMRRNYGAIGDAPSVDLPATDEAALQAAAAEIAERARLSQPSA